MGKPSVFVLGAQKCGTTTVADMLAAQPEVFVPSVKETYFFCDEELWAKGQDWYSDEYYNASATGSHRLLCDATPFYLASREAIDRLADYADPDARFIVTLRNPVDRAYSAYWHQRRLGNEPMTFEESLDAEPERIAKARAAKERWWRHAYVEVGRYAGQLEHAFDKLGREKVLVLMNSELRDAAGLNQRLRAHLDLPESNAAPVAETHSNQSAMPRSATLHKLVTGKNPLKSAVRALIPRELRTRIGRGILQRNLKAEQYPPMPDETRSRLEALFASEIDALAAMGVTGASAWKAAA